MPFRLSEFVKTERRRGHLARSFVILAVLIALGLTGTSLPVRGAAPDCSTDSSCIPNPRGPQQTLRTPYEIASEGDLTTQLSVKYFENVPVGDQSFGLRMYGYPNPGEGAYACGTTEENEFCYSLPGPIFRINKGYTFYLKLKNELQDAPVANEVDGCNEENKGDDVAPNCFHGNNITNFHFHGFHISPQPPHDNIFLKLGVGEEYDLNSGVIPQDQAEGTHWYHPHHHGATALQVMNGMASAFLVEGAFDEYLEPYEEKVIVLQEVNSVIPFPTGTGNSNVQFVVNGQLQPVLAIGDGEVERWRVINANGSQSSSNNFAFPPNVMVRQIAMDGVQFARENYVSQPLLTCDTNETNCSIDLAPGNRADFLVKGTNKEGKVRITPLNIQSFSRNMKARKKVKRGTKRPLFSIVPDRTYREVSMDFPPADTWPDMPSYLDNILEAELDGPGRDITYSMEGQRGASPYIEFYIDDRQFSADCVDQRMAVDTAEQWTFQNLPTSDGTTIAHPAHIHVNPFQVWVRNGQPSPGCYPEPTESCAPVWQDVIALPTVATQETVIRQRFENFEGMFVMHCHILGHEDRGMMQTLEIGDASGCDQCPSDTNPQCEAYRSALAEGRLP